MVGGLLSAYELSGDRLFLSKCVTSQFCHILADGLHDACNGSVQISMQLHLANAIACMSSCLYPAWVLESYDFEEQCLMVRLLLFTH